MDKTSERLLSSAEAGMPRRYDEPDLPVFVEKGMSPGMSFAARRTTMQNGYQRNLLLGILALFFLLGIILGALMSARGGTDTVSHLADMLSGQPLITPSGEGRSFAILAVFAYPLLCFFLGLSLAGPFTIPLVFAFRAFVLTFAISSLVRIFGLVPGLMAAAALFALPLLLSLPCLFIMGVGGMGASLSLLGQALGRGTASPGPGAVRRYFLRAAFCALPMAASVGVELYVCPILAGMVFS